MESNHPGVGLPPPAGFEDRMGHQTPAAPRASVTVGLGDPSNSRDLTFPLCAPVVPRVHGVDSWEQAGPPGLLLREGGDAYAV